MKPFLKWPGGKRWLISRYSQIFPQEYNAYFEPFLGGGSAFFHLTPQQATIADINKDLINTYRMMTRHPEQLRDLLEAHQRNHNSAHYYQVRNNIPVKPLERAAKFIYLNRTCFTGMYRVNQLGQFNVPIGSKEPFIEDIDLFHEYAKTLQNTTIRTLDFVETICMATEGDLVFADPPYTIAHNQNSFIKYNEKLFSWKDQKRLLRALTRARNRGATIIATNAYYPELQRLYIEKGFFTCPLVRYCSISGLSEGRGNQEELLVTSYEVNLQEE